MAGSNTQGASGGPQAPTSVRDGPLRVGDWTVRPELNRIEREESSVRIQRLSMQVLVYLAERAGNVVTYSEFLDALWPRRHASEDAVHRRIAALRSHLGDDARSPIYIETVPKRGYRLVAAVDWRPDVMEQPRRSPRRAFAAAAGIAALTVTTLLAYSAWTSRDSAAGAVSAAAGSRQDAAQQIQVDLMSTPTAAEVAFRPYADPDAPWEPLGITPLRTELPEGAWALRLMADGHETVELAVSNPGIEFNNGGDEPYTVVLPKTGSVPPGMVYVPETHRPLPLWGLTDQHEVGEYFISRSEVTNAEYAEFVASGGYRNVDYWQDLVNDDDAFEFADVATRLTDSTGRPGPAGWIDGTYQPGTADLPVTGVSWYEAMAYARFRGLQLPAAPHWARAALGVAELERAFAPVVLAAANIESSGPIPAADERALSPFGATNLIGNAAEWTRTSSGNKRLSLGLGFRGQAWAYAMPNMADALSRLPTQGFRLAKYDENDYRSWNRTIGADAVVPQIPHVTDEEYADILAELHYDNNQIGADDFELLSEVDAGDWVRRRILLPTSDTDEPLPVVMFVPKTPSRPLQSLIYLTPGSGGPNTIHSDQIPLKRYQIELLVESGRAIVWPILYDTHERFVGDVLSAPTRSERGRRRKLQMLRRREEIGRTIDFLAASPEFDENRIGMLAASAGAVLIAPYLLASDDRFHVAVFLGAGILSLDPAGVPPFWNPNTYWPRITLPAFLAHGRYDVAARFAPPDSTGATLYDVLGTPEKDKRLAVYEMAHWPFPPLLLGRDLLPWLDEYLGPVD